MITFLEKPVTQCFYNKMFYIETSTTMTKNKRKSRDEHIGKVQNLEVENCTFCFLFVAWL